jgi:hypothetical protein
MGTEEPSVAFITKYVHMAHIGRTWRQHEGFTHIPLNEVVLRMNCECELKKKSDKYHCPCRHCHGGGRRRSLDLIKEHLRENGRDSHLMQSQVGGNPTCGCPSNEVWAHPEGMEWVLDNNKEEDIMLEGDVSHECQDIFHDAQVEFMDVEYDIQQLYGVFEVGDELLTKTCRRHGSVSVLSVPFRRANEYGSDPWLQQCLHG